MDPVRIEVTSERGRYPVAIGTGLLPRLADLLREAGITGRIAIVSCAPVWRRHGSRLRALLRTGESAIMIPDGERAKTLRTVAHLYDTFTRRRLDRTSTVIAFGGGVVGDVAGFAAATFLRGLHVVQVPTTLLAQVDSAIGGKVGVNLTGGKNMVGAFHPPDLVACDPDVLVSLPRREFQAGLYEVVKYGVIASRPLFERVAASLHHLYGHDRDVLVPVVAECCRIKADVVMRDEREAGPRRVLNFGHTIGHALEAVTRYRRFRHGEAVGYGMRAMARLAGARGVLGAADEARVHEVIGQLGPKPPVADLSAARVLQAISHDKKVSNGRLHVVLPTAIGATDIVDDVTPVELRDAIRYLGCQ